MQEGSPAGEKYRNMIFYGNACSHWKNAIKEPQNPRPAQEPIETPNAHGGHRHGKHEVAAISCCPNSPVECVE